MASAHKIVTVWMNTQRANCVGVTYQVFDSLATVVVKESNMVILMPSNNNWSIWNTCQLICLVLYLHDCILTIPNYRWFPCFSIKNSQKWISITYNKTRAFTHKPSSRGGCFALLCYGRRKLILLNQLGLFRL